MSIRDIAREARRAYGTVHRALVQSGVMLRPRGGGYRKK